MTDEQKNRIRALRQSGCSYRQVADDLLISVNTVKSFCRRDPEINGNNGSEAQIQPKAVIPREEGTCRFCGKPLVMIPGKRKKEFCNSRCRSRYWTAHRNEITHRTVHTFHCAYCGKEFTVYGKTGRKYCSSECYFADRFGEH